MSSKPSLDMRRQAVEHVIAFARSHGLSDDILSAAEHGVQALTFLAENEALVKEVVRLRKQYPELSWILEGFKGARLVDVRPIGEGDGGEEPDE